MDGSLLSMYVPRRDHPDTLSVAQQCKGHVQSLHKNRSRDGAVRWQVFQRTVQDARARNAGVPVEEINAAVEDALASVRAERSRSAG
jgi:multidrug efflux pump subunit AcrB